MPGITKRSPIPGRSTRFCQPSKRRFPGKSGSASRFSSRTFTKPGGPPLGDASDDPSAAEVASTRNGAVSMNETARASSAGISLVSTRSSGSPTRSRRSWTLEIVCWSVVAMPGS